MVDESGDLSRECPAYTKVLDEMNEMMQLFAYIWTSLIFQNFTLFDILQLLFVSDTMKREMLIFQDQPLFQHV
jgi:hypothetical protein